MPIATPRAVFVIRESDYELLLAHHATQGQARFFLEARGQSLDLIEARHEQLMHTVKAARAAVPAEWRQATVRRADLDRFLFAPEDVVVAIGQDGLVANVAKYLNGQPVLGINPSPDLYDGILVRVPLDRLARLLPPSATGEVDAEHRTMVEAVLDGGDRLLALNEIFIGHRSHQSARYTIATPVAHEDQSSSGLIVASGTGATGWARSIMQATHVKLALGAEERAVGYFVREPFPSIATGTTLTSGRIDATPLHVTSRMNDGGVIFADGIEQDFLSFDWGRDVAIGPAAQALVLVAA